MRDYDYPVTVDRNGHPLASDRLPIRSFARPALTRYSLLTPDGFWEPVQPSAQKVHHSYEEPSWSSSRLHEDFSRLDFSEDLYRHGTRYLHDKRNIFNKYFDPDFDDLDKQSYRMPETAHRTVGSTGMLSRPSTKRVIHDSKDRMISIPIEHVRSCEHRNGNHNNRKSHFSVARKGDNLRKNSNDFIDLSDYEDSLSDDSDCDIYPFLLRNRNNNSPDVKTRRGRSSNRNEPYPKRIQSNSPSPETESRYVQPEPTTSYVPTRRSRQDDDILCLSDISARNRKEEDKLLTAPPHSRFHEEHSTDRMSHGNNMSHLTSSSSDVMLHRCKGRYNLIEDDEDSAFSINQSYQFSDDSDGIISRHSRLDKDTCMEMDESPSSRKSSDSDEGITPTPNYPAYNIIRDMIEKEGRQVDYIRGDGNCFFRALSKVIYNTESCHEEIRQAVVDLMEKYPKDFEQFIDGKSLHDHIIAMRQSGTWGTQAEIYGAATLLQRDLFILSPDHSGKKYRWLLFSPRFKQTDVNSFDLCYITLCHTNGNHYDRIAPKVGKCNCAIFPPQLSGVKGEVDLTSSDSEEDLLVV